LDRRQLERELGKILRKTATKIASEAVEPPVEVDVSTGNGNDPPARKLASFPSSVIRFGSARICRRFRCCSALRLLLFLQRTVFRSLRTRFTFLYQSVSTL